MTHDETMDALCKRIAELNPHWASMGMSCRDRELGTRWTMYGTDICEPYYHRWVSQEGELTFSGEHWGPYAHHAPMVRSLERAIAAGPDWHAATTVLGLLALVPNDYALGWIDRVMIVTHEHRTEYWCARKYHPVFLDTYPTREEAIVRAVVAHLEARQ
jgi:hypothetical protein